MTETLLNTSAILLFGRVVEDLRIDPKASDPAHSGAPGHLAQQLAAKDPGLARVYGFGLAGVYHLLPTPALFLVHGPGAPAATLLGLVLGAAIGLITGWFGSWVDEVVMRVLDAVMAFPIVILAMLALTFLGAGTGNVILVIGLVFAPLIARTVRAAALVEARKEYVQAAQLRGEGALYIMAVELLPNVRGPLIVEGTVRLGYAVFTSATLGFLGLGVQPPTPDWGLMVSENQALLTTAPWTVLFPALGIAWVVVAIGLAADGLKEYLEP